MYENPAFIYAYGLFYLRINIKRYRFMLEDATFPNNPCILSVDLIVLNRLTI